MYREVTSGKKTVDFKGGWVFFTAFRVVIVAQLVRAPGFGPGGRGFKSRLSPQLFFDLIFIFPNPNPFFLEDAFF